MAKKKGTGKGGTPSRTPQRQHQMRLSGNDEAGAGAPPDRKACSAQQIPGARGAQQNTRPRVVQKNVAFGDLSDEEDTAAAHFDNDDAAAPTSAVLAFLALAFSIFGATIMLNR